MPFNEETVGGRLIPPTVTLTKYDADGNLVKSGKIVSNPTTNLVSRIALPDRTLYYWYDAEERITSEKDYQGYTNEYTYDAQGQLTRHVKKLNASDTLDNAQLITYYEYDSYGNILAKGTALGDDEKLDRESTSNSFYTYESDRLISYTDGTNTYTVEYDEVGNPKTHNGTDLVWEKGRQLKKYGKHNFVYNANGIRTSRFFNSTVDGETQEVRYNYELEGSKVARIVKLRSGETDYEIIPLYDNNDSPVGIIHNGTPYWYVKNLQGDIVAIKDSEGTDIVRYTYDAWGKVQVNRDNSGCSLSINNPFFYRGYIYDREYNLYYLQSRYYDPEIGRFINPDELVFATISNNALECNLYSYCENNPVNYFDPSGFKRWLINVKINKAIIFAVDLVIVALMALLTCFAAVKLKYSALKVISWYNKNSIIKKLKGLLVKLANLIVGAIHTVVYAISDTVPQWALRLSAISIAKVLIDFIELSPAEILLNILDRFDGDGKSGYIRYAMI